MQILCSKGARHENERSAENIGINENFDLICPVWMQLGIPAGKNKETVSG
jgi:hypothetical protein